MMRHPDRNKVLDRFLGSAMGTFVGDALGEPVEGWSRESICRRFGVLDSVIRPEGRYTDDTQMMIGILEVLMEKGGFDPAMCARRFEENFDPARGYGRRIFGVVRRIREGTPWNQAGTDSFGNGAAMRISPIGCFYWNDLQTLRDEAILSARITHNHPEAIAGAVAQATAVALAFQHGMADEAVEPARFIDRLMAAVKDIDEGFASSLGEIKPIIARCRPVAPRIAGSTAGPFDAIAGRYGLGLRAIESVPPAIAAFLLTGCFRDAVILAVNLGGDTDTIGAMAGAVSGAYYGHAAIPQGWLSVLENGEKGRDYVIECVKRVVL